MSHSDLEQNYSNYGIYSIDDSLDLSLPNTTIKIKKIGNNVFSYNRLDAEENLVEKTIPVSTSELNIELAPIRPLNYPARRTDYVYLDLDTPIFLSSGASAKIYANCPIEIGIFLIHDGRKDSLDWFTCNHIDSRFCLYGSPESGTLCNYAQSEIVESLDSSIPYTNGVLEIHLKNELSGGFTVSKLVFPISAHSIYYKNSNAIIDSLQAVLKKKLTLEILDVDSLPIETDWAKSPTYERAESIKHLDMGID